MAVGLYKEWLTEDALEVLRGWARSGLTDEQIAHNCGIATGTLYEWKKKHPEIAEALKKGKAWADTQVENALFKRATGYDYDEVTYEGGTEIRRVKKHMAGDVTAQIIWLKNRRPDLWRDRRDEKSESADTGAAGVIVLPEVKEDE